MHRSVAKARKIGIGIEGCRVGHVVYPTGPGGALMLKGIMHLAAIHRVLQLQGEKSILKKGGASDAERKGGGEGGRVAGWGREREEITFLEVSRKQMRNRGDE